MTNNSCASHDESVLSMLPLYKVTPAISALGASWKTEEMVTCEKPFVVIIARLVYYIPRFEHITPVLYRLHWLPVSFRIEYKVLILTYKAIHGFAPLYISDLIRTRERTNYNLR